MSSFLTLNSYFDNTHVLEWSYIGFLNGLKPYFISDPNSIENQNSVWRKRYLAYLKNFLDVKEKQGLQVGHNKEQYEFVTLLLQEKDYTENFWKMVELEKEINYELEKKKIVVKCKSQIDGLELLDASRQQQNLELVDELKSQIQKKPRYYSRTITGTENPLKRPVEEVITPLPNLRDRSPPPSYKSGDNSFDAEVEDYTFISKRDDDSDYVPSDVSDVEDPPPLLTSSQFKCFDESYAKMKKTQKWILSSGTCVEDVIFEYCKGLSAESLLHSWVIDLDDQEAEDLFTNEEWREIRSEIRKLPKVDETFVNSVLRFADVKTTGELRNVLETTSYRNLDEPLYDREKHYDAEWVDIVMRKYLTDYEDPNGTLHRSHLESWHDINVWSLIIDHGLRNLIGIETVRKESSSEAVSARKNRKRLRTRRKNIKRKKMGSRMDGIFRTYVNDVEYGVIEVAKKFDETKLLTDGYKLSKAMHDILICLSKQVHFDETKVRELRVAGMLHLGLKTQVLHLSSPKGYVSILKRENLLEVPVAVEKIRDLIKVLTSVWMLKKMIIDCVDIVNSQVQTSTDFKQELMAMGTETPPPSIVLPWSCDTK